MDPTLAAVIPLSLGAAVSPTVLGAVVLTLSSKVAPRARAWVGLLGMAVALLAITVALGALARVLVNVRPDPRILASVDALAGLALVALGIRDALRLRTPAGHERARVNAAQTEPRLALYFGLGALLIVTDVTSLVLYVPAMKDIVHASIAAPEKILYALIPFLAVLAPAIIPVVLATVAPRTADRVLGRLNAWVTKNQRVIGMVVCFAFGIWLLYKGAAPFLH